MPQIYFTFAKQIFHIEDISLVPEERISLKSEELKVESCIVKTDCSKSENMVKYFQESERDEKENELHKGV